MGEGLVGRKIRIAYPNEDGEGCTYWPVTVKTFSVDTNEHLVVGEGFESREDLHDCHWPLVSWAVETLLYLTPPNALFEQNELAAKQAGHLHGTRTFGTFPKRSRTTRAPTAPLRSARRAP